MPDPWDEHPPRCVIQLVGGRLDGVTFYTWDIDDPPDGILFELTLQWHHDATTAYYRRDALMSFSVDTFAVTRYHASRESPVYRMLNNELQASKHRDAKIAQLERSLSKRRKNAK